MNDARHAAYEGYLREIADLLLLRDWEILLQRNQPTGDVYASVWIVDTENCAWVRLSDAFWGRPLEERREWLVHELCHIHLDRIQRVFEMMTEQDPDNAVLTLAKKAHLNELEVAVQRLARILAPLLPLPPEVPL